MKRSNLWTLALLLTSGLQAAEQRELRFFLAEEVFPHIAAGGVWSTELTFVNLGEQEAAFPLFFFRPDGTPWTVTLEGIGSSHDFTVRVQPDIAFTVKLESAESTIETGWALIAQPPNTTIGGHATFSDRTPGRPLFEAVSPLSSWGETEFVMPFDNTGGNVTCVAIANAAEFDGQSLVAEFTDDSGSQIALISRDLLSLQQQSFCLSSEVPATVGKRGSFRVRGSGSHLSALGFRFNPGGSFTTLFPMTVF